MCQVLTACLDASPAVPREQFLSGTALIIHIHFQQVLQCDPLGVYILFAG